MITSESLYTPLVVIVLVAVLLLAAALVRRYQTYQGSQRVRLKALVLHADWMETRLARIAGISLSQSLRKALYDHLAAQYVAIARLHPDLAGIREKLDAARKPVAKDNPANAGGIPAIADRSDYLRLLEAIEDVIRFLNVRGSTLKQAATLLPGWYLELRERRAELDTRYLLMEANRLHEKGNFRRASQLLGTSLEHLKTRGPQTGFVRELHAEVKRMHARVRIGDSILPVEEPVPGKALDQISNKSSAA